MVLSVIFRKYMFAILAYYLETEALIDNPFKTYYSTQVIIKYRHLQRPTVSTDNRVDTVSHLVLIACSILTRKGSHCAPVESRNKQI